MEQPATTTHQAAPHQPKPQTQTQQQQQQTPPQACNANQTLHIKQQPDHKSTSQQDIDLTGTVSSGPTTKLGSSPPGSYTSTPPRSIDPSSVPPILPPHLLQVILNHPEKANSTILPQPNHVMLNHLYALSIKEGIMVLSATHRFRKKYVTTLLYKPIN